MPQVTLSRSRKQALIVDAQRLNAILGALAELTPINEFTVTDARGYDVKLSDVAQITAYADIASRAIRAVSISQFAANGARVGLELNDSTFLPNFSLRLTGEQAIVDSVSAKVEQFVLDSEPSWSFLATTSYSWVFWLPGFVWLLLLAYAAMHGLKAASTSTPDSPAETLTGILLAAGLIGVGLILDLLKRRAFPIATFAIGAGEKEKLAADHWRNGILLTLALGVISSLAASSFTGLNGSKPTRVETQDKVGKGGAAASGEKR